MCGVEIGRAAKQGDAAVASGVGGPRLSYKNCKSSIIALKSCVVVRTETRVVRGNSFFVCLIPAGSAPHLHSTVECLRACERDPFQVDIEYFQAREIHFALVI